MISSGQLNGLLRKSNMCTEILCYLRKVLYTSTWLDMYFSSLLFKQISSGCHFTIRSLSSPIYLAFVHLKSKFIKILYF
jgi:hypothetical protein